MDKIQDLRNRVASFSKELASGRAFQNIVKAHEAAIVQMNAEDQLFFEGINSLGVNIMSYAPYAPLTKWIKANKHQPTNRVTLRDTGDFHRSFYVVAGSESFEITASDEKTEALKLKYGKEIFGLTEESRDELATKYLYPELLEQAKKEIYG